MNLVICTTFGLIVIALIVAAAGVVLYPITLGLLWLTEKSNSWPEWTGKIWYIVPVMFGSLFIYALLGISHEVGCKVIHLTHSIK